MMATEGSWSMISVDRLADDLRRGVSKRLLIDSRSFLEFNTSHIVQSVNVSSSKIIKRRLQQDKLSVRELLSSSCQVDADIDYEIIAYDQCTTNPAVLAADCFLVVLVSKLINVFRSVYLLKGGFLEFQATHPSLCDSQTCSTSGGNYRCPPLTSMSQPCMSSSNVGPTKILPFLFLGSQQDALSEETMKYIGITYVLNVSTTSPKPPFIQEGHFLRIPVNDSYCDKLLPHFKDAFQFLDKVREANGCVLVHCLAGISRSPTLAIAYVMRLLNMTTDEAYKYVKDKRPTISPNFNFLGQLVEYEKLLCQIDPFSSPTASTDSRSSQSEEPLNVKKQCIVDLSPASPSASFCLRKLAFGARNFPSRTMSLNSPTTGLAKLNFSTQPSPVVEVPSPLEVDGMPTPRDGKVPFTMMMVPPASVSLENGDFQFAQLSTSALSRMSFTPCFARHDATLMHAKSHGSLVNIPLGGSEELSSGVAPPTALGTARENVSLTKGCSAKRPLSVTTTKQNSSIRPSSSVYGGIDSQQLDTNKTVFNLDSREGEVVLRHVSSDIPRGRHPLPRPNSIAFSSYHNAQSDFIAKPVGSLVPSAGGKTKELAGVPDNLFTRPSYSGELPDRSLSSTEETLAEIRHSRKSRSLEDILNSPDEEQNYKADTPSTRDSSKGSRGSHKRSRLPNPTDTLCDQVPPASDTKCHWQRLSDRRQSSGSISSGGSSLHGSLEVIEVS